MFYLIRFLHLSADPVFVPAVPRQLPAAGAAAGFLLSAAAVPAAPAAATALRSAVLEQPEQCQRAGPNAQRPQRAPKTGEDTQRAVDESSDALRVAPPAHLLGHRRRQPHRHRVHDMLREPHRQRALHVRSHVHVLQVRGAAVEGQGRRPVPPLPGANQGRDPHIQVLMCFHTGRDEGRIPEGLCPASRGRFPLKMAPVSRQILTGARVGPRRPLEQIYAK